MTDLISFYGARVVYDLADYEEADFTDRVILCVPRFAWLQARNLMRGYGLRPSAYAEAYTNQGYYPPGDDLFDKIDESISDFLGERDMCQELVDAVNNLAVAFQAGCCGEGTFGAGEEEPPASSQPDEEGDFPEGFDTYAEYRAYKCAIANRIIGGIKEDMEWLVVATLVTLVANNLLAAFWTPIPLFNVLLLVGTAVSLWLQGDLSDVAQAVVDTIDAEREALVCLLYDAENATQAKEDVKSYMESLLTATENGLFVPVWTFAAVNALFGRDILLEASPLPDDVSCDGCTSECETCVVTNDDETQNGVFTIISPTVINVVNGLTTPPDTYWASCEFNTKPGELPQFFCGPAVQLDSYALTGFTPWATQAYRVYDEDRVLIYNSSTPPDWSTIPQVRTILLKSTTPFTGTITLV